LSEEEDIYADHHGYQREHVQHDDDLSSHQLLIPGPLTP